MQDLNFMYFFGSGYSYLSVMRIDALAQASGVTVHWRPFSVRALMIEQKNPLRSQHAKLRYIWRDIERRAAQHGVPFVAPPVWPTDPEELANRVGIVAMTEGWCREYSVASFRSWYLEGKALGDPGELAAILERLGRDPDAVVEKAGSAEIRARYDAETDFVRRLGGFGAPTFVVGDEVFWGDDRLEEAIDWAAGRHRAQAPKA